MRQKGCSEDSPSPRVTVKDTTPFTCLFSRDTHTHAQHQESIAGKTCTTCTMGKTCTTCTMHGASICPKPVYVQNSTHGSSDHETRVVSHKCRKTCAGHFCTCVHLRLALAPFFGESVRERHAAAHQGGRNSVCGGVFY